MTAFTVGGRDCVAADRTGFQGHPHPIAERGTIARPTVIADSGYDCSCAWLSITNSQSPGSTIRVRRSNSGASGSS
jgi:hypothetical protein